MKKTQMKGHKVGLAIAIAAFAIVLAAAFISYNVLSQWVDPHSSSVAAQSETQRESGTAQGSGANLPLLADYNSTVYTEDDTPIMLSEIADGKPLVINFWATWCPYCIQEMDDYQQLYDEYRDRVSFAFIDCVDGLRETVADGATWLADNGHDLPAYYDTDRDAIRDYGATNLPTTVVANAAGEILSIMPGVIDPELMRNDLDSLLVEQ